MQTIEKEINVSELLKQIPLERRECARNAGVAIVFRLMLMSILLLALNTLFLLPQEEILVSASNLKSNILFILVLVIIVPIMLFSYLPNAFALNNVFSKVQMNISLMAAISRVLEGLFFLISLVLVFFTGSFYIVAFLFGYIFYGLNLVLIGYLVTKSGYLDLSHFPIFSKVLGSALVFGGFIGYFLAITNNLFELQLTWLSTVGLLFIFIVEIIFGVALIWQAKILSKNLPDPKKTITDLLKKMEEATTEEIVNAASKISKQCKDRVPGTLKSLEKEKIIVQNISKEKKAIVWSLA